MNNINYISLEEVDTDLCIQLLLSIYKPGKEGRILFWASFIEDDGGVVDMSGHIEYKGNLRNSRNIIKYFEKVLEKDIGCDILDFDIIGIEWV